MTTTDTGLNWPTHALALADQLRSSGDIRSDAWHAAVTRTPRHVFVPRAYEQDEQGQWQQWDTAGHLERVYSSTTLVTAIQPHEGYQLPISSSTTPALMLRMLEHLEVRDGHRVLEIGTGTGYNSALLAHRLGEANVFSVDVETNLVDLARERLAAIGRNPVLASRDGVEGLAEHGPYDRIIATCSVPAVPRAWADQLTPDGAILVDVRPAISAGNLAYLHRHGDRLEGRFLAHPASFMAMRHTGQQQAVPAVDTSRASSSTTRVATPWAHSVPWFLSSFRLPANPIYGRTVVDGAAWWTLTADDGSHAVVAADPVNGEHEVIQSGPGRMWDEIETAFDEWEKAGAPDWDRFGLTVEPGAQVVWCLDTDQTWRLGPA